MTFRLHRLGLDGCLAHRLTCWAQGVYSEPPRMDPPIRILAQTARPATVRSLDAIHLGTALHARQAL